MKTYGLEMILPEEIQKNFNLVEVKERKKEIQLYLTEKEENKPESAKRAESNEEKIVLNGYRSKLELIDFPLKGKLCYLLIKRRRWKIKGTKESFENHYKLHEKGVKCTIEFGNFLKSLNIYQRYKFFRTHPDLRNFWKENFSMVSRIKRFFRREKED